MKHKLEKSIRIIDEILGFCCKYGSHDVDINYNATDEKKTIITFTAKNVDVPKDSLLSLDETLNMTRQHEVEECYWLLGGDDSYGDELELIGCMVDKARICYSNKTLTLTMIREED